MRYEMRLDRVWRPLLATFGGTSSQSYVEIDGRTLRFRYGWGFGKEVPLDEVMGARRTDWPALTGIGWRIATRGRIGLTGSLENVVEVRFRSTQNVWLMTLPWRCSSICVSLLEPDRFLADLRAARGGARS